MSEFSGSYLSEIDEFYTAYRELRDRALLSDRDGLPAESFENFSEMPLTFEEMAAGMRQDLEKVYTLTGSLNRFSADYPLVCRQLERMIRRIGSCCVTKTVLEQKGFVFPALNDLNMNDLFCMVSFNFRKTRTAYHDSERLKGCADMGLLELECRWVDLAERLQATEEKIRMIRSGKLNADRLLERAELFKGEKSYSKRHPDDAEALSGGARALPVIGSVARQMIAERKAEEAASKEMMRPVAGVRTFQEARPFPPEVFRPSKAMKALARQEEETEKAEQREMLAKFSRGEISATGAPVRTTEAYPAIAGKSEMSPRKSRKQRRREMADARAARKEWEEMAKRSGKDPDALSVPAFGDRPPARA